MKTRVVMRDVAKASGVHYATVSRALRNDPRISSAMRTRVQAVAKRLGYTPDPLLRALADYRTTNQRRNFHGLLAWLTNFPTSDGWKEYEKIDYFEGASRRARELGYKLEVFWAREPGVTPARLRQIMLARGILGVLLPPQPLGGTTMDLRLGGLASVSFGHTLTKPTLNVVHHYHFRSMWLLLEKLRGLGYRRPGLVMPNDVHKNVERAWAGAWMMYAKEYDLTPPPLFLEEVQTAEGVLGWYREHKPDVVIANQGYVLEWLRNAGVRVPRDCGFALTAKHAGPPSCAGIDEKNELTGASAVELLVSAIQHGETDVPKHPKSLLIEGSWFPGNTVRKVTTKKQPGPLKPA